MLGRAASEGWRDPAVDGWGELRPDVVMKGSNPLCRVIHNGQTNHGHGTSLVLSYDVRLRGIVFFLLLVK